MAEKLVPYNLPDVEHGKLPKTNLGPTRETFPGIYGSDILTLHADGFVISNETAAKLMANAHSPEVVEFILIGIAALNGLDSHALIAEFNRMNPLRRP